MLELFYDSDLTFLLLSTPSFHLPHAHKFLIVAPIAEGLLGGFLTLQSATSSYLSDCTSVGSRSQIFSLFTGLFYVGFFIGPSIAGYLLHHPISLFRHSIGSAGIDLSLFWLAIIFSFTNFVMALFLFPESLRMEKMERARREYRKVGSGAKGKIRMPLPPHDNEGLVGIGSIPAPVVNVGRTDEGGISFCGAKGGIWSQLISPLAIFLPARVSSPGIARKRLDWNLTLLTIRLFAYTLSTVWMFPSY